MRNERIRKLAAMFHEDWRKSRLRQDGFYEPRWKTTNDEAWIKEHGASEVDIANTTYDDLPSDWQAENKAAAEVVVGIMERFGDVADLTNPDTYNQVGEEIHQAWLERNSWARGGELDISFSDLPKSEQLKDIAQMEAALELFGKRVD